jgi:hypothetical protein
VWSNEWSEGPADPVSVHGALTLEGLLLVFCLERSIPMARVPAWDPQLLWYTVAVVGALLVGAAIVALADRWRKKRLLREAEPADLLARYTALHEKGDLSTEEYERIRKLFKSRMVQKLSAPVQKPPLSEPLARPAPDPEDPQNPSN